MKRLALTSFAVAALLTISCQGPSSSNLAGPGSSVTYSKSAEVKNAFYLSDENVISMAVQYRGRLPKHEFSIQLVQCFESLPASCIADLIDKTKDEGVAIKFQIVSLPLAETPFNDSFYSNASLTIRGANGTSGTINLPEITE